ncbi:unnamed protein product [Euphydryas editha]|uniref:Uncharacterized protein n=1 Tax=Euphydryas editha TaxID=104508 RepID=A0AAU9U3A8_EUPED|nr:unnamed protein product [Euphydryas editha]
MSGNSNLNKTIQITKLPKPRSGTDIPDKDEVSNMFTVETNNLINTTIASDSHIPANNAVVQNMRNSTNMEAKTANGTIINLEDRSAFVGDTCPTGYVKVLGQCTEIMKQ